MTVRSLVLLALLGGCIGNAEPTESLTSPGPTAPLSAGSGSPTVSRSASPSVPPSLDGHSPGSWEGRVVVRLVDGSFAVADAAGARSLQVPPGEWFLGSGTALDTLLLLSGGSGSVDAAVARVDGDSLRLASRIGTGDSVPGGGCLSPGGTVALADLETLTLALVERGERTPIELDGHASVGECAWLSDTALVAPAEHDHRLLYVGRAGRVRDRATYRGLLPGAAGRHPSGGRDALSLTTGNADDEAISVFRVGPRAREGDRPPAVWPETTLRPGDGPRRGTHALSSTGRWLAVAALERGAPVLLILDVDAGGRRVGAVPLPLAADGLAFLEG